MVIDPWPGWNGVESSPPPPPPQAVNNDASETADANFHTAVKFILFSKDTAGVKPLFVSVPDS
jgi:hypothetical protein